MSQEGNKKGVIKRADYEETAKIQGKNYLLVIGIDKYAHCPTLYNAVKDAKDIVEVLQTRFQFEKEHITTLYNEQATKRNIYNAFRTFRRKVTDKDNFIVYFSGHGEFDKDFGLGYWIPVNAELGAVDAYIPNSEIRNIFSAIKSHHTFLMVDSCFSGALFAKGAGKNISLRKERDPSRWGLTAGRNEIVTDGEPGKNSPFAESILYQLKNADRPIGVAELCDKVLEVVSANANQTPRGEPLKVEGHQGGQFVFHLKMDEAADWKNALDTYTIAAFQTFVAKYPNSEHFQAAQQKIKAIQAASLWLKIETAKDENIYEVNSKLRLINQFVDKYEDQPHYDEALNIGELLEYKRRFLQAKDSEFALRRFLRKTSPKVKGAETIRNIAQLTLDNWNNEPPIAKPKAIEKKTATKKVGPSKPKPSPKEISPKKVNQKQIAASDKKYWWLLLLIPLVIWGIINWNNDSEITPVSKPEVLTSERDNLERHTDLPIEQVPEPVEAEIPKLEVFTSWGRDVLNVRIEGGQPPFDLQLLKGSQQRYTAKVANAETHRVKILKEYRETPGTHVLTIEDSKGQKHTRNITIDAIPENRTRIANLGSPSSKTDETESETITTSTTTSSNAGTFKDSRNGQTYKWVRLKDGKKWMAENLNYKTSDSWCYDDKSSNCTKYGRLYTWQAARKACPSGWRLPTDDEWRKMAKYYGGCDDDASDGGKAAYAALMQGGNSGFAALLGGFRLSDGDFNNLGSFGDYWSSTGKSSSVAWCYYFNSYDKHLLRYSNSKSVGRSCRCLQD